MSRASCPPQPPLLLLTRLWWTAAAICSFFSCCSAQAGPGPVDRKWTRIAEGSLTIVTVVTTSSRSSVAECAVQCLRLSGCAAFCRNGTSRRCYLGTPSHSGAQGFSVGGGDASGTKCFSLLCPTSIGYEMYKGRCMKMYTTSVNYASAQSTCAQDLGHLYYFKDAVEDLTAVLDLRSAMGVSILYFWMGGGDQLTENSFFWNDGSPLSNDDPAWNVGEPNDMGGEDCVNLDLRNGGLNDETCSVEMQFICQIDV